MSDRNGEGETNKQNDRVREQGKRGSTHSKTGEEKQQDREEGRVKHSQVLLYLSTHCYAFATSQHLNPLIHKLCKLKNDLY